MCCSASVVGPHSLRACRGQRKSHRVSWRSSWGSSRLTWRSTKLGHSNQGQKVPSSEFFSDCAGIRAETIALTLLGLKQFFTIVGGSEIDEVKRCLIGVVHETCRTSCKSESFATDIFQRDPKDSPGADIYLAGFPCPAFSKMGRRFGLRDSKKRGIPLVAGLRYIAYHKPPRRCFAKHLLLAGTRSVQKSCRLATTACPKADPVFGSWPCEIPLPNSGFPRPWGSVLLLNPSWTSAKWEMKYWIWASLAQALQPRSFELATGSWKSPPPLGSPAFPSVRWALASPVAGAKLVATMCPAWLGGCQWKNFPSCKAFQSAFAETWYENFSPSTQTTRGSPRPDAKTKWQQHLEMEWAWMCFNGSSVGHWLRAACGHLKLLGQIFGHRSNLS